MFCQKCGKELTEGAKFCPECGAEVGAPVKQPLPQSTIIAIVAGVAVVLLVVVLALVLGGRGESGTEVTPTNNTSNTAQTQSSSTQDTSDLDEQLDQIGRELNEEFAEFQESEKSSDSSSSTSNTSSSSSSGSSSSSSSSSGSYVSDLERKAKEFMLYYPANHIQAGGAQDNPSPLTLEAWADHCIVYCSPGSPIYTTFANYPEELYEYDAACCVTDMQIISSGPDEVVVSVDMLGTQNTWSGATSYSDTYVVYFADDGLIRGCGPTSRSPKAY